MFVRFAEHNRKLTQVELNKVKGLKNPKKKVVKQSFDEHEPSAVSAHAMLDHEGTFNFSIGVLSVKRQEDERLAYETLAVSKLKPSLNKQLIKNNGIIPT